MEHTAIRLEQHRVVRIGVERYVLEQFLGAGRHSAAYFARRLRPDDTPVETPCYVIKHPVLPDVAFDEVAGERLTIPEAVYSQFEYVEKLYRAEEAVMSSLSASDPRFIGIREMGSVSGSDFIIRPPTLESGGLNQGVLGGREAVSAIRSTVTSVASVPIAVLPFVPFPSLRHWCAELRASVGGLTPDHIVKVLRSIVRAVDDLHAQLVVHNDLSSTNVLVQDAADGLQVLFIDFDQAYSLMQSARIEQPRKFLRSYSRPERAPVNFDADIYQIGTLALYLMTGVEGFEEQDVRDREDDSDGHDTWSRVVDSYLNQTSQDQSHPALAWIRSLVIKCTTPHYRERYRSIHDLLVTINQIRRQTHPRKSFELFKEDFLRSEEVMGRDRLVEEMLKQDDSELLARITFARQIRGEYELMRSRSRLLSVYGDHEEIVHFYVEMMGSLAPGSKYQCYSSGSFWSNHNLGTNGRFLVACRLFVDRGGYLSILFVVPPAIEAELRGCKGNIQECFDNMSIQARDVLSALRAQTHAIEMLSKEDRSRFAVKILVVSDRDSELVDSESSAAFIAAKVPEVDRSVDFTLRNLLARRRSHSHRLTAMAGDQTEPFEEFIFGVSLRRNDGPGVDAARLDKIFHGEHLRFLPVPLSKYLASIGL